MENPEDFIEHPKDLLLANPRDFLKNPKDFIEHP